MNLKQRSGHAGARRGWTRPADCAIEALAGTPSKDIEALANVTVIGGQWGDEGKGKIVDWLASRADLVVRFQGGHNAGHTLVVGDQTYKLSLLPSGIVRGTLSVIGNGVVLDPWALKDEVERLGEQGVSITPGQSADRRHLPAHPALPPRSRRAARGRLGRGQDRHHPARHRPGL